MVIKKNSNIMGHISLLTRHIQHYTSKLVFMILIIRLLKLTFERRLRLIWIGKK